MFSGQPLYIYIVASCLLVLNVRSFLVSVWFFLYTLDELLCYVFLALRRPNGLHSLCHNHVDNQCLFSKVLLLFKYTREEVADMVRRLPSLLGFSVVTVLQPKYSYLVEVMQRSPKELVRFPHFFSYSLEKRIIPRHQVVGEASQSRSLSNLYGCNDALFEKKLYRWKLVSKATKSCNI